MLTPPSLHPPIRVTHTHTHTLSLSLSLSLSHRLTRRSVAIASDPEPCFDTQTVLGGSGAGWAGGKVPMRNLLRFHNIQAAAIHAADPKALVTVGSWSEYASTDAVGLEPGRKFFNYYKDACLVKAGGKATGTLDFYQIHTYADSGGGAFHPGSPMSVAANKLALDKPVVIGEFSGTSTMKKTEEVGMG